MRITHSVSVKSFPKRNISFPKNFARLLNGLSQIFLCQTLVMTDVIVFLFVLALKIWDMAEKSVSENSFLVKPQP